MTEEDIEVDPYLTEMEIRTYLVERIRRSIQGSLDYRFDDRNTITLRGMYNWRIDRENRFAQGWGDVEPIFADNSENIIGYEGILVRETKGGINNSKGKGARFEDQRVFNTSISGDHLFANFKVDWMASFSKASEEKLNERYIAFELEDPIELTTDFANTEFPFIGPANSSDAAPGNLELSELTDETGYTQEKDFNLRLDIAYPVTLNDRSGELKFGGRGRFKSKFRDNSFFEYSPVSGLETLADAGIEDYSKNDFLAGEKYRAGSFVTPEYLGNLDFQNGSLFEEEDKPDEYLPENFDASEDVIGIYAQWYQDLSNKFSFLAGVRMESTSLEYTANEVLDGEELSQSVTNSSDYTNFLPGVHLKYKATPRTIIRAAWSNTLGRPNYFDLAPYRNQVDEDEEIFAGNPDLNPTTSMNLDLMADYYFTSVGLISGGLFYKQIDDFIYILEAEDPSTGYDLFQPQNGGSADLFGFEVSFQRQLDFLPGFWKGLGVYLNYTHITSSTEGIRNEDGDLREDVDLPGTAPKMFNASLSYESKKLVMRASLNYSDTYIDELSDDSFYDRYYDEQLFIDFNTSYAITENLRFFAELNNITNQPLRYFQGISERTMQMEYYGMRLNAGFKYDLFRR